MSTINNLSKKLKLIQKVNELKKLNIEEFRLTDIARTNKEIAEINNNLDMFDEAIITSISKVLCTINKKLLSRKKELAKIIEIQKCYYNDIQ